MSFLFRKKTIEQILQNASENQNSEVQLEKNLSVRDLTGLGVAAVIGAGIFSTIGTAAASGGPAVSLLFIFTALGCGLSALCYARFASLIPISGSAYTYSYATFGELFAWIIGWDLIMEYAVGNIAVAISWSDYFTSFLQNVGVHFPSFLSIDYLTASRGFAECQQLFSQGQVLSQLSATLQEAYLAWTSAPTIFNLRIIADIPAFSIVALITILVYIGIYETKLASNLMVLLKIVILLVVIGVGAFFVDVENWKPFAPNGLSGVLKGISGVFFAYIGFDAISTTSEECKNPQRDLPRGMIYSLIITTILYVLISIILTGMVKYSELNVGDPLSYVFAKVGFSKLSGIIAVSAIIAMASVLLVFQVGQPRIWMSMSRDGLLPPIFSKLHKRFKTPWFSTVLTGIIVAIPSLFLNLTEVTDLTSIGTLFAFVLVSGGALILDTQKLPVFEKEIKIFKIPYLNSRYFLPFLSSIVLFLIFYLNFDGIKSFFVCEDFWNERFLPNITFVIYIFVAIILSFFAIKRQWSFIPLASLLINFYLMTELHLSNWLRFFIWLAAGLLLYFLYGMRHSKLNFKR